MKMKMKNISYRCHTSRLRPRRGHKYSKYRWWSSIHEKVEQHWGEVEKSVPYKNKSVLSLGWCEADTEDVVWKSVLKSFAKLTRKHLRRSLFFSLKPSTLLKEAPRQTFSCELWKILRTYIFYNMCERLLLNDKT